MTTQERERHIITIQAYLDVNRHNLTEEQIIAFEKLIKEVLRAKSNTDWARLVAQVLELLKVGADIWDKFK